MASAFKVKIYAPYSAFCGSRIGSEQSNLQGLYTSSMVASKSLCRIEVNMAIVYERFSKIMKKYD